MRKGVNEWFEKTSNGLLKGGTAKVMKRAKRRSLDNIQNVRSIVTEYAAVEIYKLECFGF